jgi:hypothetical protein
LHQHLVSAQWLTCRAAFLTILFAPPLPPADPGQDDLRRAATRAEQARQWDKARDLYEQLLVKDRTDPQLRRLFLNCHRLANLVQRHRDSTYRDQLADKDLRGAFRIYREIVGKLRGHYLDPDKVDYTQLFQYGLEELLLALDNDVFRQERLPGSVATSALAAFRSQVHDSWSGRIIQSQRELETEIARIAQAGRVAVGLEPVVTVMEFVCGACHGLDEYTLYLTPGQLADVHARLEGIHEPSVADAQVLREHPGVAYCRVLGFQKATSHEFDEALVQLQMQGMKILILDLRGNGGGYVPSAIEMTERFLPAGKVIVTTVSQVPDQTRVHKAQHPSPVACPVVVLVDQETASAAEVVAGALQAHQRATLVGQPTFGKWSMQRVLDLKSASSGLRVTLARFLSPGSQPYTIKGVIPDVLAEQSPGSMADNQLLVAIQVALRLVEPRQ